MTNPRLATRYAKSLLDLSQEQQSLEATYADMLTIKEMCSGNRDFVQLLKSPVVNPTTKKKIVTAVTEGKIGTLVAAFAQLLITKTREANLPEIADAFILQYKALKGIQSVKLTTAEPISQESKNAILAKMNNLGNSIELEAVVDEKIIGGFILQTGDNLVDVSIAYDLRAIQKQFLNNDFIYKIK